jgi:hypothetical protein
MAPLRSLLGLPLGVLGPLGGALLIQCFGVRAVYAVAGCTMLCAAGLVRGTAKASSRRPQAP